MIFFSSLFLIKNKENICISSLCVPQIQLTHEKCQAFKFTSDGFIRMTTILAKEQPSPDLVTVKFMVEDSGVGISEASLSNVFLPFSQADSKTGIKFGGTGLGLSISKEVSHLDFYADLGLLISNHSFVILHALSNSLLSS